MNMAEVDPYAQFVTQPPAEADPSPAEADPYAQFAEQPGYAKDAAKTAAPSLLRGTLGALTMPSTLSNLAGDGASWLINKIAPNSDAAGALKLLRETDTGKDGKSIGESGAFFPTADALTSKVEDKVTGPMYHAQTGLGKALQTGLEVLPSLATGGAVPAIAKATGAGLVSEGLGQAADAGSSFLPAWAAPVARGVGAMIGTATPAGARRAVTPLPMAPEQAATVAALKATNPAFVESATAGQLTNSPKIMALEGRAPRMEGQGAKQADAYSDATFAKGRDTGAEIGQIYDTTNMGPAEFAQLKKDVTAARSKFQSVAGAKYADGLKELENDIKLGASGNPTVTNMTGKRYQFLRDELQKGIDAEGNNTNKKALSDMRGALDKAFSNSLPDKGVELANLRKQKVDFETLANHKPNMRGPGNSTQITPEETLAAVAKKEGNKAANADKGTLAPWARNAKGIMQDLPKPSKEVPPWADLGSAALGGILSGGVQGAMGGIAHGASGAAEGSVLGHLLSHSGYQMGANAAGRAAANPAVQNYLKNQRWLPGAGTTGTDTQTLLKLLASPAETQLLNGQQQ